jgi:UDPglucose 6-dehydrogenase
MSRVSVIGLGRLGLPLAVALASKGFKVVGVDNNPKVLDAIKRGNPPTYEPGLEKLLKEYRTKLSVTDDLAGAVDLTEATFVMVATPSEDNGRLSPRYILGACRDIGKALKEKDDYHLVVINSTVNPTDCKQIIRPVLEEESGKDNFGFCYSPEFVALGTIILGFLNPDFVLIGAEDIQSFEVAEKIYRRLCPDRRIVRTNLVNAELIKIWLNCTLITKISLANQIGEMCEAIPEADVDVVTGTIGLDKRTSPRFLMGGTAYGGPCFPRDSHSILASANAFGVELPLINVVEIVNQRQVDRLVAMIWAHRKSIEEKVGILGLSYKVGVDSMEPSTGLALIRRIVPSNSVIAYDPMVQVGQSVRSAQVCVDEATIVVITIPCPEFKNVRFHEGQTVIDCWRMLDKNDVEVAGAKYFGIGKGKTG